MARAGTARTDRAGVSRWDLRVGKLTQAGLLLQEHSVGITQSVGVNNERNTVSLKSGTSQQTAAIETISTDMILTVNMNEKSKRNLNLFMNTGISDYDEDPTKNRIVETSNSVVSSGASTGGIDKDDTAFFLSASDSQLNSDLAGGSVYFRQRDGVLAASSLFGDAGVAGNTISRITDITAAQAANVLQKAYNVIDPGKGVDFAAYIAGAKAAKAVSSAAAVETTYDDGDIKDVLVATKALALATPTSVVAYTPFAAAITAIRNVVAVNTAETSGTITSYKAAVAGSSEEKVAVLESRAFTFLAADNTAQGSITIGGLILTRKGGAGGALTDAQFAGAWANVQKGMTAAQWAAANSGLTTRLSASGEFTASFAPTVVGAVVTFTSTATGNVTDLTYSLTTAVFSGGTIATPTTVQGISQDEANKFNLGCTKFKAFVASLPDAATALSGVIADDIVSKAVAIVAYHYGLTTLLTSAYRVGITDATALVSSIAAVNTSTVLSDNILATTVGYLTTYDANFVIGFNTFNKAVKAASLVPAATLTSLREAGDTSVALAESTATNNTVSAGSYVLYDREDPMTLSIVEVISFDANTYKVTLSGKVGIDFSATQNVVMYKANVIAPLRDIAMPYYSARLVELDSKSRAPEVLDIWKCAITSGSNMTLNATDFSAWDIVLMSVYPTISDMNGDLAHVKDKINAYGACARYTLNDI